MLNLKIWKHGDCNIAVTTVSWRIAIQFCRKNMIISCLLQRIKRLKNIATRKISSASSIHQFISYNSLINNKLLASVQSSVRAPATIWFLPIQRQRQRDHESHINNDPLYLPCNKIFFSQTWSHRNTSRAFLQQGGFCVCWDIRNL